MARSSVPRFKMHPYLHVFSVGVCVLALFRTDLLAAKPFVPDREDQVLEILRPFPLAAEGRELRQLRRQLRLDPRELELAVKVAWRLIEQARNESDPRYLGYAQAALQPWWTQPAPPAAVLLLRATLRQSNHEFDAALSDLDEVLKLEPANAQAWLTRATILQVQSRYDEARRSCLPLARCASRLVAVTCAASIGSLTGEAPDSLNVLLRTLAQSPDASAEETAWAWTLAAEVAARLGRGSEAEGYFQRALEFRRPDAYLLGAYADFLLDRGDGLKVIELFKDKPPVDAILLRLALAHKQAAPGGEAFRQFKAALESRFEAARRRGESLHAREEARFVLHLLGSPRQALELAQANWKSQREPADARILLEAALACRDSAAAEPVLRWLDAMHRQDVQLVKLASRLRP